MLNRLIVGLAEFSQRHALVVALGGLLVAALCGFYAVTHLEVTTDTDRMFSSSLPWRQQADELDKDFPQFRDLLVAVIDAREPEEADATAAALADALAKDHVHFNAVRRPDASPFLRQEGLLFLDIKQLTDLMDRTIDAQPFLGQLVADPSARGLFSALSLLGMGVTKGDVDLGPYLTSLNAFHQGLAEVLSGHPRALSWQALLGGGLNDLAGKYVFVLAQPKLDYGALQPGGEATAAMRQVIAGLEFVKSGDARVRITGQVALADEEFATVVQGAVVGLAGSIVLITLWLFLAVQTWRLILPILATLGMGLVLTLFFASVAVGTLNLVSVGFGILFVGIAVDFAIQFSVRYRERRFEYPDPAEAMRQNAIRTGDQIMVAAAATSVGFLGFVPTNFSGVAELGLIAGVGMLIAFVCTLGFLPAIITLCHPPGEQAVVGFSWLAPFDPTIARHRRPILAVFIALAVLAVAVSARLEFDSDPLHTKDPTTEAMRTLYDLMDNPVTNPYSINILSANVTDADALKAKLVKLPTVSKVINIDSFVPDEQPAKLALIADANSILTPTLLPPQTPPAPVTPAEIQLAAKAALAQIDPALAKLPKDHPLAAIAADLHQLLGASDDVLLACNRSLTRFLPEQLDRLRTVLNAEPVTRDSIPPDVARDWLLPDGRARVQVLSTPAARSSQGLELFVADVTKIAPNAGGSAVTIEATAATIVDAFRSAALIAIVAITLILFAALRRVLDVGLVLAPLILSALLTLLVAVMLPLPLNFANIIALPLLLGVGVSFNIYFVMNWRAGRRAVLGSATARAIVFSALTTGTAFGSLALSDHPGTASMGKLLLISLGCTLLASLVFIPALLSSVHARTQR